MPDNSFGLLGGLIGLPNYTNSKIPRPLNSGLVGGIINNFGLISQMKKPSTIPINDTRKIDLASNTLIGDRNNLSGKADLETVNDIIKASKKVGFDPYTALAIAHQETGLSAENEENPFHGWGESMVFGNTPAESYEKQVAMLKDKFAHAQNKLGKKTEPEIIQSWNGYGKVGKVSDEGTNNKLYGIDVSKNPIDMNTNPVYGKRIIDIRENIIKKHPEIVNIVNQK